MDFERANDTPERRLMGAILLQAISDAFTPAACTEAEQLDAIAFLTSQSGSRPRDRAILCQGLDLDPDLLREWAVGILDGGNFDPSIMNRDPHTSTKQIAEKVAKSRRLWSQRHQPKRARREVVVEDAEHVSDPAFILIDGYVVATDVQDGIRLGPNTVSRGNTKTGQLFRALVSETGAVPSDMRKIAPSWLSSLKQIAMSHGCTAQAFRADGTTCPYAVADVIKLVPDKGHDILLRDLDAAA